MAKPQPPHPRNLATVNALLALMAERNLTVAELSKTLYGFTPKGNAKGGQVYSILKGQSAAGPKFRQQVKAAFGAEIPGPQDVVTTAPPQQALTPARAAVVAHQQIAAAVKAPQLPEQRRHTPPLFALSIDQDGRANVTLNLMDIPAADAIRCLEALVAANLIKRDD